MQLAEGVAAQCRQLVKHPGVEQRQAVENAARQFGIAFRNRLPGVATGGLDLGAHTGRVDKAVIVAVNYEAARR